MDKPTKLKMVELAGWGGGPGMTYAIKLVGPMSATFHDDGSVVIRTEGSVTGPTHALKPLGGKPADTRSQRESTLPKGRILLTHVSKIRLAG